MSPVVIGTPSGDQVAAEFTASLFALVQECAKGGFDLRFCNPHCGTFVQHRNTVVRYAKHVGASHIMWLDADMIFPHDTLSRLLAHDTPIVGCTYRKRHAPYDLVHMGETRERPAANLVRVRYMPCGVMLVRTEVYERIGKPYRIELASGIDSADYQFCKDAADHGYEVLMDRGLSAKVGHICTQRIETGVV